MAIAGAYLHSLALTADGRLVSWGDEGPKTVSRTPVTRTPAGSNFAAISAGGFQSVALTRDGRVEHWAAYWDTSHGHYRPTGDGIVAIAAGETHSVLLRADGTIYSWGKDNGGEIVQSPAGGQVLARSNGPGHADALDPDGQTEELVDAASPQAGTTGSEGDSEVSSHRMTYVWIGVAALVAMGVIVLLPRLRKPRGSEESS